MTLSKEAYLHLMAQKKVAAEVSGPHFDRMQAFMGRFLAEPAHGSLGVFGPVDVGQGVYWWDYGQLKLFQKNALLATAE
jgi:hypothetical protein